MYEDHLEQKNTNTVILLSITVLITFRLKTPAMPA